MGGGGAGLRGKQTPHVAALGRGPRAGGGERRLRPHRARCRCGTPRCLPGRTRSSGCRSVRAAVRGTARDRCASAALSAHPGTAAPHCAVPLSAHPRARYRCPMPLGAAVSTSRCPVSVPSTVRCGYQRVPVLSSSRCPCPARPTRCPTPPGAAVSALRYRCRGTPPVPHRSRSFSCSAAPRAPEMAERLHRTPGAGTGAAPRPRSSAPPQYPRRGHRSGGTDLCCRYLGRPSPNRAAQCRTGPDRAAQCRPVAPLCARRPPPARHRPRLRTGPHAAPPPPPCDSRGEPRAPVTHFPPAAPHRARPGTGERRAAAPGPAPRGGGEEAAGRRCRPCGGEARCGDVPHSNGTARHRDPTRPRPLRGGTGRSRHPERRCPPAGDPRCAVGWHCHPARCCSLRGDTRPQRGQGAPGWGGKGRQEEHCGAPRAGDVPAPREDIGTHGEARPGCPQSQQERSHGSPRRVPSPPQPHVTARGHLEPRTSRVPALRCQVSAAGRTCPPAPPPPPVPARRRVPVGPFPAPSRAQRCCGAACGRAQVAAVPRGAVRRCHVRERSAAQRTGIF